MRTATSALPQAHPSSGQLLDTLAATGQAAAAFAPLLRPGDAVLLHGPLGAGKTAFARALLRTLTGNPSLEVPSPSYTLVQIYHTQAGPVHHFDLWRLDGPAALPELGWDDAIAAIVVVEWPDRLGPLTPPDAWHLHLEVLDDDRRLLTCTGGRA